MSKEATIIQSFNDIKRQYEYSVKGYDVTESVKILLKKHKEAYDKEKNVFAGVQGFIEAQQLYKKQITDLEAKLAESEKERKHLKDWLDNEILTSVDHESYYATINEYEEEIKELKQQLAEKDTNLSLARNEINTLKHNLNVSQEHDNVMCEQYFEKCKENNQDKISFCIEQLEKVKEFFLKEHRDEEIDTDYLITKDSGEIADFLLDQIKQLKYQQINELKGEQK